MATSNGTNEFSPLIQKNSASPKPYYFLTGTVGRKDSLVDHDERIERLPAGATGGEFASRPVMVSS